MNSFRSVVGALRFEDERQRAVLRAGGSLTQETRGWVETSGATISQRTKEQAHDYRYFPEPDLPPVTVTAAAKERIFNSIGELPRARRDRYVHAFQLSGNDASLMSSDATLSRFFEEVIGEDASTESARMASNWLVNDVIGLQRARSLADDQLPITPGQLRDLIELVQSNRITGRAAKELLGQLEPGEEVPAAAARLDLLSLEDEDAISTAAIAVMEAFPAAVEDFRGGKTAAIGRLIGETIKRTGGRASPESVRALLIELLER
jgi:aspartyl-tRNA(Asn)/glutamyl-tRNA(Gln) amidotransferase subunit B